jgi:proteasome assembly chaperone (PAC2) family protein
MTFIFVFYNHFLQHIWLVDDSTVNQSDSVFYIKKSVSFGSFYINAFLSLVEESINIE